MALFAQQTQVAPLEMYAPIRTGTSSIEVGKEYVLATRVWNLGTSAWKGALYLKVDGENVAAESANILGGKKQAFLIRGRWKPSHAGRYKVELFYQTNERGRGRLVTPGRHLNPQYLDVEEGQVLQAKLHLLQNARFEHPAIELGQSSRYEVSIGNDGNKDWSGVLFLKSEGEDIYHWSVDIRRGGRQTISFNYRPTQVGTREYILYAQEGGVGRGSNVDGDGYSNSARLSVLAVSKAKIKLSEPMGFSGGVTTLEKGKRYRFKATVVSDKDWSGAFYLKKGDLVVSSWNADLRKGASQVLTFDYTPTRDGVEVLTLYSQDGGHGSGEVVDRNGFSNPIAVTIKKESTGHVGLQLQSAIRIYPEGESTPSLSIIRGKKCTVKVSLYNKTTKAYMGAVCLKDLKSDNILLYFAPNPAKLEAKGARQLTGTFVARASGSYRYGLFYKEGEQWVPVDGQRTLSPIVSFTIGDDFQHSSNYKLRGASTPIVQKAGSRVESVQIGLSYEVVSSLINEGEDSFVGELCLRRVHDRKVLCTKLVPQIGSKKTEKVCMGWMPTEADYNNKERTEYELCSKLPTGEWRTIPETSFTVGVRHKTERGNYNLGIRVKKLIPDINELVPSKGDRSTCVYYTYRVFDAKNIPISGIKLRAKIATSSLNDRGVLVESTSSDEDGYITLSVSFASHLPQSGVEYYCTYKEVVTPEGKEAKVLENEFDTPFVLSWVKREIRFNSINLDLERSLERNLLASAKGKKGPIEITTGLTPKFSVTWNVEEGNYVDPVFSFGAEMAWGGKFSWKTSSAALEKQMEKNTKLFSIGLGAGLKLALEGEAEMNGDPLLSGGLYLTEVVCRLGSTLVNKVGGRWSNGLGNCLESYADNIANTREEIDDIAADLSGSVKGSAWGNVNANFDFLKKISETKKIPGTQIKLGGKTSVEASLTNKFHNSSIPSENTQTVSYKLKWIAEGGVGFALNKSELESLKEKYKIDVDFASSYIFSRNFAKEYNNTNILKPMLQKVVSKSVVGFCNKLKFDVELFECVKKSKIIAIDAGVSGEIVGKAGNKGTIGGNLLSYMNTLSYSGKKIPIETGMSTIFNDPLSPEIIGDFMRREYDPSKISSYHQTSSSDLKKDYCFERNYEADIALSLYAKELKIGGFSLIEKDRIKEVEFPFSLKLKYPSLSHTYYYAAGNRFILTDESSAKIIDVRQDVALAKRKVKEVYDGMIDAMQDGVAKATQWAIDRGMAFFSEAGEKTIEFVNSVRDYLGSLSRSAELRANPQTNVSHIRFVIPGEGKVFDKGTHYDFSYAYPAGEATGICKQDGDEFVVISDIFFMRATYNDQQLQKAPNGEFRIHPEVGIDDLTTLSLKPDSKVMLYYLPLGAQNNEWQRIGEARGVYSCMGLGNYALGVSLQQDKEAPVVTCFPDRVHNRLLVEVEDNIGIRWSSLSIVVNGKVRKYQKTAKHSQVVVPLMEGELADGLIPTIIITVEDLAHNKGSYEQYNPDDLTVDRVVDSEILPICYPNPARAYVDVRLADAWLGASYYLYTSDGKLVGQGVFSEAVQRISLPESTDEMCYLRISMADKTYTQAIIRI